MTNALRSGSAYFVACFVASTLVATASLVSGCATGSSVGVGLYGDAGGTADTGVTVVDGSIVVMPHKDGGIVFVGDTGTSVCPTGSMFCAGSCVNTATAIENCGGCGIVCDSGACTNGSCAGSSMSCTGSEVNCGTTGCTDTATDPDNCGACGMVCSGGGTCTESVCSTSTGCPMGEGMCGTGSSALCTDTSTDPDNCGTCGNVCPDDGLCTGGQCSSSGTPDAGGGGGGCAHSPCQTGAALEEGCDDEGIDGYGDGFVDFVCEDIPSCCSSSWDNECVEDMESYCDGFGFDECEDPGC